MKKSILSAAALSLAMATPAYATSLVADGVTYTLNLNSISANTAFFTLFISGENTASDTEGGRTGVNAIAFNNPTGGTVTGGTLAGFNFVPGGLNSGGCNGTGNFFCFDNPSIPPTPGTLLSGLLTYNFSATSDTAGVWTSYNLPDFKIDWVGTKNNYDLVSLGIPVNNCTDVSCGPPTPQGDGVPEPATWAMMLIGFAGLGYAAFRRNKKGRALAV